jgi:hypothetical protein
MRNSLQRYDDGDTALRTGRNFQQMFKIQMMKKERKEGHFMNESTQENQKVVQEKLKAKPKRIINILLNGSNVDLVSSAASKSHRSNQIIQNTV